MPSRGACGSVTLLGDTIRDSVDITPIGPHKTVRLAADGVESIPERPFRYQVVGCCVGGTVSAVSDTCCRAVSLVGISVASSSRFLQLVEHQPNLVFHKQSVSHLPADPGEILRRPSTESETIPKAA